jgi:drug/metabolite transporter (DMT)-like permease
MGHRIRELAVTGLLLAVTAVWGWTFVVVKDATAVYGVVPFLAVRFTLAVAAMAPLAARSLTLESLKAGVGLGVILAGGYLFQTFGLQRTSPTNSGLVTGLFVVFAPLWGRALFGVRLRRSMVVAVAASVAGLLLLTGGPSRLGIGDALTLGCAIAFGGHIALLDRHAGRHRAAALAFAQLLAAAVVFWLACPMAGPMTAPPRSVWPALLLTGLAATAGGFYGQTAAQRHLPAVRAALLLALEPVWAAVFGCLLAGDRLSPIQLIGGALMVAAVAAASVLGATGAEVKERRAG